MINYFNFKKLKNDKYLITNDFGEFAFVDNDCYSKLIADNISRDDANFDLLVNRGFVIDGSIEEFIQERFYQIRNLKSYCLTGTSLHIFAVTNACNLDCIYCQAHSKSSKMDGMMSVETGKKAIELAMQSPNKNLTFEFQGGEPLLNFNTVKEMILYSKNLNRNGDKNIEYTIVTNLTKLDDNILEFLGTNNVQICTSLDGPREVHNYNRPYRFNRSGSYNDVIYKIRYIREKGINVNAIQTTTKISLDYYEEIIDEYINIGMNNVFIRPLTPLGLADSSWEKVGYTPEEFLTFYKNIFNYIIKINKKGHRFVETHAMYFLKKILHGYSYNYMELRSPCGASLGQMSYYYNGEVYSCDEGRMMSEMGDFSFRLGNVYDNSYSDFVDSSICKTICKASIIESLPKCNSCAYQPYCGTCPVVNYASTRDLYSKNIKDYRCSAYKGIMDLLFEILERNDKDEMNILFSWIE